MLKENSFKLKTSPIEIPTREISVDLSYFPDDKDYFTIVRSTDWGHEIRIPFDKLTSRDRTQLMSGVSPFGREYLDLEEIEFMVDDK